MSAEFDLEIYRIFMSEISETAFDGEANNDEQVRGSLLYICLSMADGGYSDFRYEAESENLDGTLVYDTYYEPTRKYLDGLKCRPLLQPWLEERNWPPAEIAELKATHAVTTALRPE